MCLVLLNCILDEADEFPGRKAILTLTQNVDAPLLEY
jgi:hypothetical protein